MDFFGLLGLLLLFLSGRGRETSPASPASPPPWPTPRARRRPQRRTPPIIEPPQTSALPPAPAPWPQVIPSGLPPFPGSGWEFDEPPPVAVQQRAAQLVSTLWSRGSGAHKVEQTAGRWIAYQAQIVASGKQGIVAYRLRKTVPRVVPRPAPAPAPSQPRPMPSPASPPPSGAPWHVKTGPAAVEPERIPVVAPTSIVSLPTLRVGMGMSGPAHPDVAIMQQRLGIVPADGRFGPATLAKVKAYQSHRGLVPDGVVGRQTWAALFTGAPAAPAQARGTA